MLGHGCAANFYYSSLIDPLTRGVATARRRRLPRRIKIAYLDDAQMARSPAAPRCSEAAHDRDPGSRRLPRLGKPVSAAGAYSHPIRLTDKVQAVNLSTGETAEIFKTWTDVPYIDGKGELDT